MKFSTIFELRSESHKAIVKTPNQEDMDNSKLSQIASYVASTGQVICKNILSVYNLLIFK